jgi:ACS family hexuronate transporter-like MFS transporter
MPTPTSSAANTATPLPPLDPLARPTRFRWVILGLVFFGTTVNYMDRLVMSVVGPYLMQDLGWTKTQYGYLGAAFAIAYAFGQIFSGRWRDWIGTRRGYAIALAAWSVAGMATALARTITQFGVARAVLGVTESPAFPAATKALAEWFPKKERALAFGFVNTGTVIGAILAPVMVPWLYTNYGWQSSFAATGAIGLLALLAWWPLYRRPEEHPSVNAAELAHIHSDPAEPTGKIAWAKLLTYRQTWAFAVAKFLTDAVWWFHMTWIPDFLKSNYGTDIRQSMPPLVTVYALGGVGSIIGGYISSRLIKSGLSINVARKTALVICSLTVLPIVFAYTATFWPAVLLVGLAVASHQGFSSNLYTLVSDMFPKRAVASVAGLGGMCGYFGGMLLSIATGWILDATHNNYIIPFIIAASAYLVSVALIQLLVPRLEPAQIGDDPSVAS